MMSRAEDSDLEAMEPVSKRAKNFAGLSEIAATCHVHEGKILMRFFFFDTGTR